MKKQAGITMTIMLYLMAAIAIAYVIRIGGNYPTGVDTMCHVYKGDVLYHAIRQGNWYPLYDRFWYNGVQMMRYWAPLPVYFLAFCQAIAGGVDLEGYLVFVSLVFYLGALVWLVVTLMELLMHLLHQKEQELICHLKKQQQLILQVVMS